MEKIKVLDSIVYKFKYQLDWAKVKPIAEECVSHNNEQHVLDNNGLTSYMDDKPTHKLAELQPFFEFIEPIYKNYIQEHLSMNIDNIVVQNAWFTKYWNQGWINLHDHPTSIVVACLYIEKPENSGHIQFTDVNHYHDKQPWHEVKTYTDDVLLFDAKMPHKSKTNLTDNERWTLTVNIGYAEDYRINEVWKN